MAKNFCKDLRDCTIYFPCSYFITGFASTVQIQQCQVDFVFDEARQECVQPRTREDFQCLLMAKTAPIDSNSLTVTAYPKATTQSTLSNEFITNYEQSFGASSVSNKVLLIRKKLSNSLSFANASQKKYSSLKKKKNVEEEYEYEDEPEKTNASDKETDEEFVEEKDEDPNAPEYKRMCIVTDWSQFRASRGQFKFEYINTHLL